MVEMPSASYVKKGEKEHPSVGQCIFSKKLCIFTWPTSMRIPDKKLSNLRTLWKKSSRYVNHMEAQRSLRMCPRLKASLCPRGTFR